MGKNIFATITHVAEKITEAITGHKNDEQAHPTLTQQINVLSTGKSDKLEVIKNRIDSNEVRFDSGVVGFNYSEEATDNLPPQAYIKQEISQRVGRSVEIATGVLNNFGYSPIMLFRTSHDSGISDWQQLATTTKTDILQSDLLNGWTIPLSSYDSSITKMGNQVFVKLMVKNEAPNPDTILVLPYPAIKATHLFVATQNRKSIQCRVVNNTIIISNYQGLEANEWVNINGSYTTNS